MIRKRILNKEIITAIEQVIPKEDILSDEPMSRHTTFKCGGPASLFLRPSNVAELRDIVNILKDNNEQFFVLGNGSNLLVSDKGYDGAVISLESFNDIHIEAETQICAEGGSMNSAIAAMARDNSLTGFEFAAGIPGTIGGAMIMNAGAYGGEMKDIVREVILLTSDGEIVTYSGEDMAFEYRNSAIKGKDVVVLFVVLELQKGDKEEIAAKMQELALKRKEKQPLEYPSAGSTFKRPEGYFAGKLIEDAGLKGYSVGDAVVSEKHCGFVVNKGNATAADVYKLICDVKAKVLENSGVTLEPEVILLGDFGE